MSHKRQFDPSHPIRRGRWPRPTARRPRVSRANPVLGVVAMMLPVQATTHQSLLGESRGLRLRHLCASGANPTALRVRRRAHASGGSQADRVAIEKCPQRNRLTAAAWPPEICPSSYSSNSRDIGEWGCEVLCCRNETTPGHQESPDLDRPWLDGGHCFSRPGVGSVSRLCLKVVFYDCAG